MRRSRDPAHGRIVSSRGFGKGCGRGVSALALLALTTLAARQGSALAPSDAGATRLLITHAHLVPMDTSTVLRDHALLVHGSRIA